MQLIGRQLESRGVHVEYWFCRGSNRLAEFMETGRATLGPLSQLAPRLARGEFDVVQMTATDPAAPLVARLAAGRARVVVTARGAIAEVWDHRNCFAYTAISQGMADVNQPYTDLEIEVVRNAIDVDRFSPAAMPADGPPIVAFAGRTKSPEKDFPRFTRIARRLAGRGARVWIADPHEASWETFAGQPVERVATERWGRVPHDQIADFYRAVAASNGVVVITSRSEGFGNVAPEAAACGARVAAPNVLGLREAVVDGVTGRLFGADASDDQVAAELEEWLGQPHDTAACAAAAHATFSASVLADRYLEIYRRPAQRLLGAPVAPVPFPEQEMLLDYMVRLRGWRAAFARSAAIDLARAGYPSLALAALGDAFRSAPRQFLRRAALRELLSTGRHIAVSPRRAFA